MGLLNTRGSSPSYKSAERQLRGLLASTGMAVFLFFLWPCCCGLWKTIGGPLSCKSHNGQHIFRVHLHDQNLDRNRSVLPRREHPKIQGQRTTSSATSAFMLACSSDTGTGFVRTGCFCASYGLHTVLDLSLRHNFLLGLSLFLAFMLPCITGIRKLSVI